MKKSFKTFFYEFLEDVIKNENNHFLLKETPIYTGIYNNFLNNHQTKLNRLENIKQFDRPIKKWNDFVVYYGTSVTKGGKDYSFVYNDSLMATFSVKPLSNKGLEILSVWNEPYDGKGLARQIIFEYFLPKYSYIMCGESHTEQGKQFWIKIITECLNKNISCTVVDLSKDIEYPINNISDLKHNTVWGNDKNPIRLKISK